MKKQSFHNPEKLLKSLEASSLKLICVTGKMASGKNHICSYLEKQGWFSVDADKLVHNAINIAQDRILDTFIPYAEKENIKITQTDGTIDRRGLGQLLFAIPELLTIQESIVYPIITKNIEDYIKEHNKLIINATVLYKTPDLLNKCERIIFVTAPLLTRIKRAKKRDNLPYKQIFKRFLAQKGLLNKYKAFSIPITIINNK